MANIINNEKWNKIIITILGIDIENITLLNKFELEINLFSMEEIINNKRWIKTIITLLGTDYYSKQAGGNRHKPDAIKRMISIYQTKWIIIPYILEFHN